MTGQSRFGRVVRNPRIRGFLSMSGGALIAQLTTLAVLPIISRLYSTSDFGILALVLAISNIISPAVCLKFDSVVLITKSERDTRVATSIAIASTLLLSAVSAALSHSIAGVVFAQRSVPYLAAWVFAVSALSGIFALLSQIAIRDQMYSAVAKRNAYQAIITSVSQLGLGFFKTNQPGLLWGSLLGRCAGIIGLAVGTRHYVGRHRLKDIPHLLREHWRFPLVFAPSAVLNAIGLQLPVIVVASRFGVDSAGHLSMAERVVGMPIALIGAAMGQMFVGELSNMMRNSERRFVSFFLRITAALGVLALVLFGGLALLADPLLVLVLGSQWDNSVVFIQIMALTGAFRLMVTPASGAVFVFKRARANFMLDVVRAVLVGGATLIVLQGSIGVVGATWLLYGSLSVVYLITWVYLFTMLRWESSS